MFSLPKLLRLPYDLVSHKVVARSLYAADSGGVKLSEGCGQKEGALGYSRPSSPLFSRYGPTKGTWGWSTKPNLGQPEQGPTARVSV